MVAADWWFFFFFLNGGDGGWHWLAVGVAVTGVA